MLRHKFKIQLNKVENSSNGPAAKLITPRRRKTTDRPAAFAAGKKTQSYIEVVVGRVAVFVGKPYIAEQFEEYGRCVGSTTVHVNPRFSM